MASRPPKLDSASVRLALRMLQESQNKGVSMVEVQVELGLSYHTVCLVMRALLKAGLAAKSHASGSYVRWCVPECQAALRQWMDEALAAMKRGQRRKAQGSRRAKTAATREKQPAAVDGNARKGWVPMRVVTRATNAATSDRSTAPSSVFALAKSMDL